MESMPKSSLGLEENQRAGLDRIRRRAHMVGAVAAMARATGLLNTARLIYGHMSGDDRDKSKPIQLNNRQFRFPIHATICASDIANFHEIAVQRVYDLPDVLGTEINGKPIIDTGAYTGIAGAYFANRYPDSKILSVEPHPRNYALLEKNAAAYKNIVPIHGAIAPIDGTAHMNIHDDSESKYMSNQFSSQGTDGYSVPALSPQSLLKELDYPEEIAILKVDIEGAERELFKSSAIDAILERTEIALIETHDRFVPGSTAAVIGATARHGMNPAQLNPHTVMYSRM